MTNRPILSFVSLLLFFVSCAKSSDQQTYEDYDSHPTWTDDSTNNFWDKDVAGDGYLSHDCSEG